MPTQLRQPSVRTALIAAWLGLAGAHAPAFATPDLPIVAQSCPKEGRDPSTAQYRFTHSCGVWTPDDFASAPTWNFLELTAVDGGTRGGNVIATLQCMSRASGQVSAVAVVRSESSLTPKKTTSARLPAPLNFDRCAYFVSVDVNRASIDAQALMVSLRN